MSQKHYSTGELKTKILGDGLAQTSVYSVKIDTNDNHKSFLRSRGTLDYERINLLCCDAVLPGTSLATHEVTNDYAGVTEKMAYRRIYDDSLDLSFYVDGKYDVLTFFDAWMDYVTGQGTTFETSIYENSSAYYRMNYPSNYKSNIEITKFEKDNTKSQHRVMNYKFIGAFPTNIVSMPISYNSSEILKCTVSFSYIRYIRSNGEFSNTNYIPPTDPKTQASSNSPANPEFKSATGSQATTDNPPRVIQTSTPGTRPGVSVQTPDPLTNRGQVIA